MAKIPKQQRDPTLDAADAIYEKQGNAQEQRPYLGMSSIGHECSRSLWYGYRWCSAPTFDADTLKRFEDGHRSEAIQIERLRAVEGITLYTEDPRNREKQIGCSDIGGHFRGHLDGIIVGLLQAPATPHCWEHKCVNEKKQEKLQKLKFELGEKSAFKEWDDVYYSQGVLYMHYQGLSRHYLTVASPGSRSCVSCRTNADPQRANALIEKAKRIITSQEPPGRLSDNPSFFQCHWCSHRDVCHESKIPAVSCRTCAHATPELDGDARWSCARFGCDLDVDTQRRGSECPSHIFIPALLPWKAIDASEDHGWVDYQLPDGRTLRNGPGGFASRELAANVALCVDPVVAGAKEMMGAEVVA